MDSRKNTNQPPDSISEMGPTNRRFIASKNIQQYIKNNLGSPEIQINSNTLIYNKFNTIMQNNKPEKEELSNRKDLRRKIGGTPLNKKPKLRRNSHTHNIYSDKTNHWKQLKNKGIKLIKEISQNLNLKKETKNAYLDNINFTKKNSEIKNLSNKNTPSQTHKDTDVKNATTKSEPQLIRRDSSKKIINSDENNLKKLSFSVRKFKLYNENILLQDEDSFKSSSLTSPPYIIFHIGKFRKFWDFFVLVTVIYSMIFTPLKLCFYLENALLKNIEIFICFILMVDFVLNFFTTYYDEEENLITDLNQIIKNYFFNEFLFDLLACFPSEFFIFLRTFDPFVFFFVEWISMIRISKATKKNLTGRFFWDIVLTKNNSIDRLIKFIVIFLILTHISSCAFIFVGKIDPDLDNWIDVNNLTRNSDIYITSVYFNIVTIYTIGYGDIVPYTMFERIYVTLFMFVGILLFSYAISSLSNIFSATNTKNVDYKRKQYILNCISTEYHLSSAFYKKIEKVINHEHYSDKNEIEKYELLESLPNNLRKDLIMVIYRKQLKYIKFFKNQTHDFSMFVLPLLKSHKFLKGEQVLNVGDLVTEMYVVEKGNIGINLGSYYDKLEIGVLRENSHFGELLMQANEQCPYEVICKSKSADLLVLKENDFLKIKSSFFDSIFEILEESFKQLEILDKRRQVVMELFKFYKNTKEVKEKLRYLNIYLMDEGFINYYLNNVDFEEAYEFLDKHNYTTIKEILDKIMNQTSKKRAKEEKIKIKINSNKTLDNLNEKFVLQDKNHQIQNIRNETINRINNFNKESLIQIINDKSYDNEINSIDYPLKDSERSNSNLKNLSKIVQPNHSANSSILNIRKEHKHHSSNIETSSPINFPSNLKSHSNKKTNQFSTRYDMLSNHKGLNNNLLNVDYCQDINSDNIIGSFERRGKKSSTNNPRNYNPLLKNLSSVHKQKRIKDFNDVYREVSRNLNNNRIQENLDRESLLNEKTLNLLNVNKSSILYRNSSKKSDFSSRILNNSLLRNRDVNEEYSRSSKLIKEQFLEITKAQSLHIKSKINSLDIIKEYRKKVLNSLQVSTCINVSIESKIIVSLSSQTIFKSINSPKILREGNSHSKVSSKDIIINKEITNEKLVSSPVFHIHQNVNIYEGNLMKYNIKNGDNHGDEYQDEVKDYKEAYKKLRNLLNMFKSLT
jgi:hypothetical protein